ncbi:hypothetical protein DLM77_20855 [Leptospira yasudae]|uniref:Hint domain-containing protein n=1 Tax=Leptospira yasudae TaxID=2202201 RepID=A0ABX9LXM0_9LEPT|nr:hypothetical protein DLM77_20855 [Leptospira yasudae]
MVNKLRYKILLTVTLLSFNLLTGAESPFLGKHFEPSRLVSNKTSHNNKLLSPKPARISRLFNYEAGSGNYTASGGFNIYGDAGLSISAGKDGYASFGLNYNKDGKGWLNNLSGVGLTMGSDGVFTLSHQFKGSDTLNLSYNTNTHGFSPIGVNGNFINDLNLSLIQENAASGNADAKKKLADYYGNVLVERGVISAEKMGELMTKSGGHEELISLYDSNKQTAFANGENSPEAIKWKSETTQAVEQLRSEGLNIGMGGQSQSGGFFNDLFTSFQNSMGNATNGNGGFDTNGDFSINTCFTAGTLVHTKNGLKKIEEIGIGDQVLSWDEESGEQSYKTVTELFVHEINHLYDVEVNGIEVFHTTWNHPFWVVNERSWVKVKDLKVGDIVQLKDGSQVPITGITPYSLSMTSVYNLEVEENHTYYVGQEGVLVHNYGGTDKTEAHAQIEAILNGKETPIDTSRDIVDKLKDVLQDTLKRFKTQIGQFGEAIDVAYVSHDVGKISDVRAGLIEDMVSRQLDSITRDYDAKNQNLEKIISERSKFLDSPEGIPYVLDPTRDLADPNLNDKYKQHNENIENQRRKLNDDLFSLSVNQIKKQQEIAKLSEILNYKNSGNLTMMDKSLSEYMSKYRANSLKLELQSLKPVLLQMNHATIIKAAGGDPDYAKAQEMYNAYLEKREALLQEQKTQKCYTTNFGGVTYTSCK